MKNLDNFEVINLIDTYGSLLTSRQYEILTSYYFDNLSFSEIGENYNISRQAISDSLHQSIKALESYEEKLNVVNKTSNIICKLTTLMESLDDASIKESLSQIIEDLRG